MRGTDKSVQLTIHLLRFALKMSITYYPLLKFLAVALVLDERVDEDGGSGGEDGGAGLPGSRHPNHRDQDRNLPLLVLVSSFFGASSFPLDPFLLDRVVSGRDTYE